MDKDKDDPISLYTDDDVFEIFPDDTDTRHTRSHKIYKQHYRKAWEEESDFKGWLTSVPDQPNKAFCKVCKRTLLAHRLTLVKHTIAIKHMKAAAAFYETKSYEKKQKMDQSSQRIELQVDTNMSEEEGSVLLVDETFSNKKSDDDKALKKGGSQVRRRQENRVNEELADDPDVSKVNTPTEPGRSLVLARPDKPPISTHVLDTTRGLPVSGVTVRLYQLIDGRWTHLNESSTNPDGRCDDLIDRESVTPGRYKMHFETHQYFELRGSDCLFPFVEVVFDMRSPAEYLHIPVLMTPYSYTVYRGS